MSLSPTGRYRINVTGARGSLNAEAQAALDAATAQAVAQSDANADRAEAARDDPKVQVIGADLLLGNNGKISQTVDALPAINTVVNNLDEINAAVPSAALARAYAVSDTNNPINGAVATTDRGSKYWADNSKNSKDLASQSATASQSDAQRSQSYATDAGNYLDAVRGEVNNLPTDAQLSLKATSRPLLSSLPPGTSPTPVILTELGKDGIFVSRRKTDDPTLAGKVSADTSQAMFIQSTMDNDKVWVRNARWGVLPEWFGAVGNDTDSDGPAFLRALVLMKYLSNGPAVQYGNGRGAPKLFIPSGAYYLGNTLLELQYTAFIEGETTGGFAGVSSVLRWADNTTGIRVQWYNSAGAAGGPVANTGHVGAAGTLIQNLMLKGGFAGTENESHGIQLRARATLRNLLIDGFAGDGLFIQASSGSPVYNGNANGSIMQNIGAIRNRIGAFAEGIDTNAMLWENLVTNSNRRYGRWIKDNLTNTFIGGDDSTNGSSPGFPSKCSYNGKWYYVLPRQEAYANANPPTGTLASNQGWAWMSGPGYVSPIDFPAWANNLNFRAAGGARFEGLGNTAIWINPYQEGDQPPIVCEGRATFVGEGAAVVAFDGSRYGGSITGDAGGIAIPRNLIVPGVSFLRGPDLYLGPGPDDAPNSLVVHHRVNQPGGAIIRNYEYNGSVDAREYYDTGSKSLYAQLSQAGGRQITIVNGVVALSTGSDGVRTVSGTTAQAPNLYQSASGELLLRSTSSERYKDHIEPLDPTYADRILDLQPIWYRSKAEADDPTYSFYGLSAEQVAEIDPRLVHWAYRDDQLEPIEIVPARNAIEAVYGPDGAIIEPAIPAVEAICEMRPREGEKLRPDGVQYERLSVLLLSVVIRERAERLGLTDRLTALEALVKDMKT